MKPLDATSTARSQRGGGPSAVYVGEPIDGHIAIPETPDLVVERARPIVADLVGDGRVGVGALEPADPMVILDGLGYRLDEMMSAAPVSPLARLRSGTVVDSEQGNRFRVGERARLIDIAHLPAHLFGVAPPIVAVQLSGSFNGVTAPPGIFGRTQGTAVGFVTRASRRPEWHLCYLTSDRTLGGRVLDVSIEDAELTIWAPAIVYQARVGVEATTLPSAARSGR